MRTRDIRRIVETVRKTGVEVVSVKVNPNTGEVTVSANKPGAPSVTINPWDATHASNEERSA
jgi:ABC-type Zn uptake system ZnuABC Zn-binding protein ZnuA